MSAEQDHRDDRETEVVLRVDGLTIGSLDDDEPPLVDDVSFTLTKGSTLGIVGESGSGKSLTCKAILGILPRNLRVRSGRIEFDGHDVTNFGYAEWLPLRAERVAAIFQDPGSYLNPLIKVGYQLEEVLRLRGGLDRADAYDRAISLFEDVGLRDPQAVYERYPFQLSGGMLQRVVIAIAVSLNPGLLIADEATTALDVTVQAEILRLLDDLRREQHLSLVFVSHDLAVISEVSEDIVVMQDGRIIERGESRRVLDDPHHEYTMLLVRDHAEYGLDRFLSAKGARA